MSDGHICLIRFRCCQEDRMESLPLTDGSSIKRQRILRHTAGSVETVANRLTTPEAFPQDTADPPRKETSEEASHVRLFSLTLRKRVAGLNMYGA